jgi:hypothetical protein
MQTRATALSDLHSQTLAGVLLLLCQEAAKLLRRALGDVNHGLTNYDLAPAKSKSRRVEVLRCLGVERSKRPVEKLSG